MPVQQQHSPTSVYLKARSSKEGVAIRSTFVLYVDVGLLLFFMFLLSPNLTGLSIHEVLGMAFIPPVVVHMLFARGWITRTVRNLLTTGRWRTRLNFVLNAMLFVLMVVEIFSGLEISQVVLPPFGLAGIDDRAWRALHNDVAKLVELLVCMHIAMNWSWIEAAVVRVGDAFNLTAKKTLIAPNRRAAVSWTFVVLLVAMVVATVTYKEVGAPTLSRLYHQNEIAHYRSPLGAGVFEIIGETLFIVLFAVIGRICLRMRL